MSRRGIYRRAVGKILSEAAPLSEAAVLKVIATDGYEVAFELAEVMEDDLMIPDPGG